jgi:hypothetical protein
MSYSLLLKNIATGDFLIVSEVDVWRHSYGKNGCLKLTLSFTPDNSMQFIASEGLILCTVCYMGAPVWKGRSERIRTKGEKIIIEALGLIRSYADNYTLFELSSTSYSRFRPLNQNDRADFNEDMFLTDVNNRLNIGLKKGTTYTGAVAGVIGTRVASEPEKHFQGVQGAITYNLPAGYQIALYSGTAYDFNTMSYANVGFWSGTGALQTSAFCSTIVANQGLFILYLSPSAAAYAGEDGASFARVTRLRLVTDNDRFVNTTLSNTITAGANQVFVLGSGNLNLIAGMEIVLNAGHATLGEVVTITSVTASGFIADCTRNHAIGAVVRGFTTPPDLPVRQIVINAALNASQTSSSQTFIQRFPVDITDADFFKQTRLEALEEITTYGDGATPTNPLRTRVFADTIMRLESAIYGNKTWLLYLKELDIERSLEETINLAIGFYRRSDDTMIRTGGIVDQTRVNSMGFYRVGAIDVDTSQSAVVMRSARALLDENKYDGVNVSFDIEQILDANGAEAAWEEIRADDRCILMDLPSQVAGSTLDRLRNFRIGEVEVDVINGELKITPDLSNPFISFFLKR